jgi:hypothetical protein
METNDVAQYPLDLILDPTAARKIAWHDYLATTGADGRFLFQSGTDRKN